MVVAGRRRQRRHPPPRAGAQPGARHGRRAQQDRGPPPAVAQPQDAAQVGDERAPRPAAQAHPEAAARPQGHHGAPAGGQQRAGARREGLGAVARRRHRPGDRPGRGRRAPGRGEGGPARGPRRRSLLLEQLGGPERGDLCVGLQAGLLSPVPPVRSVVGRSPTRPQVALGARALPRSRQPFRWNASAEYLQPASGTNGVSTAARKSQTGQSICQHFLVIS